MPSPLTSEDGPVYGQQWHCSADGCSPYLQAPPRAISTHATLNSTEIKKRKLPALQRLSLPFGYRQHRLGASQQELAGARGTESCAVSGLELYLTATGDGARWTREPFAFPCLCHLNLSMPTRTVLNRLFSVSTGRVRCGQTGDRAATKRFQGARKRRKLSQFILSGHLDKPKVFKLVVPSTIHRRYFHH